jgi:hypothetical protein
LAGGEIAFRIFKDKLSSNIRHIQSIPTIAQQIGSSKGSSILFLGNSLIGEAIDEQLCSQSFKEYGNTKLIIEKIVPDGSDLPMWYFILQNEFIQRNLLPKNVVIGFAWHNAFSDFTKTDGLYLADFVCRLRDLPKLYSFGLKTPEELLEFVFGRASSMFANHEILRNRVLDILIPHYRQETQYINSYRKTLKKKAIAITINPSYRHLLSLCDLADKAGIRLVFVAMPVREDDYSIAPELKSILEKRGILIDCRKNVLGFKQDEMFRDEIHLNQKGREVFSTFISAKLYPIVTSCPASFRNAD